MAEELGKLTPLLHGSPQPAATVVDKCGHRGVGRQSVSPLNSKLHPGSSPPPPLPLPTRRCQLAVCRCRLLPGSTWRSNAAQHLFTP